MKEEITTKEARQSVPVKGMRHVLVIGMAGVVIAFLLAWFFIGI